MNAALPKAIDRAVAFVQAHPNEMTRAEMAEFRGLAETVYVLAQQAGLVDALPKVTELKPQLESYELRLPPVQFEGKLNLPGDWDIVRPVAKDELLTSYPLTGEDQERVPAERAFLVCASARWFADMAALRRLAAGTSPVAVEVDLERMEIRFRGESYPCKSEQALRMLNVYASNPGQWFTAKQVTSKDSQVSREKVCGLKQKLPRIIQRLLESNTHDGTRLVLPPLTGA